MLWNESARRIPFTWHRTRRGAETIPKGYRYDPDKGVSSDYYHHFVEGLAGLEEYALECGMEINWGTGHLEPRERT